MLRRPKRLVRERHRLAGPPGARVESKNLHAWRFPMAAKKGGKKAAKKGGAKKAAKKGGAKKAGRKSAKKTSRR
jgi:hypothetical protein